MRVAARSVLISPGRAATGLRVPGARARGLALPRPRTLRVVAWSVVMWTLVLVMTSPLLWAILNSLKPDTETAHYPPTILPQRVTLENYAQLFVVLPFATFFGNSVIISTSTSLLTVALAATAAYATARFRARVAEVTSFVGLAAYMMPTILIVVPVITIAFAAHALDSIPALVVLYTAAFVPFSVWQLRSYFAGLSRDLEGAAMVDGATRFQAFYLVVVPQAIPGMIATAIYTFAVSWNEYLFASLLLYSPQNQTLSAGLATVLIGTFSLYSWGTLMAAATLMTVPPLLAFMFVQRRLVAGISSGAVKG